MNAQIPLFNKNHRMAFVIAIVFTLILSTVASASDGVLDPSFGTGGVVITDLGSNADLGIRLGLTVDGSRIFALGSTWGGTARVPVIKRYFIDGSQDTAFGTGGQVTVGLNNFGVCDFVIQSDRKMVVGGATSRNDITLIRYSEDGKALDPTFGTNGVATYFTGYDFQVWCSDIAIQPDQKIIVFGSEITAMSNHTDFFIARFNKDGTLDETFGFLILDKSIFPTSQFNYAMEVAVQPNGKIIVSGAMQDYEGNGQISLGRLNADGSMDTSFGTNGKGTVMVPVPNNYQYQSDLAIQADGKIIIVGTVNNTEYTNQDLVLARFHTNGMLDTSFGIVTTDLGQQENARDVLLQKNGRIVVVASSSNETATHFMLARYDTDGQLDPTFGENGVVVSDFGTGAESPEGAALQVDGKVLVTGMSNNNDMVIARYDMGPTGVTPIAKTFLSIPTQDGWILETSNTGGPRNVSATTFNVGDDPRDRQYRSILSFQTSPIPDNAFISSVQLKIKRQGLVGTDPFTTHGNLLAEIRQGAFSNSIALQESDFSAPASSSILSFFSPPVSSWYTTSLIGPNLFLVNKYGVTQFRLRFELDDNDDMGADYLKCYSGNSTDTNRPVLVITYYLP